MWMTENPPTSVFFNVATNDLALLLLDGIGMVYRSGRGVRITGTPWARFCEPREVIQRRYQIISSSVASCWHGLL